MAGSGILEVEDGGGKAVYCFFLARLKWLQANTILPN